MKEAVLSAVACVVLCVCMIMIVIVALYGCMTLKQVATEEPSWTMSKEEFESLRGNQQVIFQAIGRMAAQRQQPKEIAE